MFVLIFRAKIKQLDGEYSTTAARVHQLALTEFGCIEFHAVTEGDNEIAPSYWQDAASIKAWRMHPEHLAAQKIGKERWYESYSVQVAAIGREYRSTAGSL